MRLIDNMPIIIVIAAILLNIAIGVNTGISFTMLMIRCMFVTIIFSIFGYILTQTIKQIMECSSVHKVSKDRNEQAADSEESHDDSEEKSFFDIKVPPLDDEDFRSINNDDNVGFVEVNPAFMGKYDKGNQD